jgi:hypothetical protein
MTHPGVHDLMPGERVLWQGRPGWRALARDVLHVRWVALYLALFLIWGAYADRSNGLGPVRTLMAGVPLLVLGLVMLAVCAGFAWAWARSTRYTITTERCMLSFGMALTVTLSVPLRRIATVSVALRADGTGDIPLALKPGRPVMFLKLWPHVRSWEFRRAQPMLRGVADAAGVAALLSQAAVAVSPGRLAAVPAHPAARAEGLAPATSLAAGD